MPATPGTGAAATRNVVATLRGDTEPNRVHAVSGHYDSRVTDV